MFALTSHFHLNVGLSVGDPLGAAHQLLCFQQIIIDRVWQIQAPMILIIAILNQAAVQFCYYQETKAVGANVDTE